MWNTVLVKPTTPNPDLASNLATEIRAISGKLKRRLREHGRKTDFTPSQTSALLWLEKNGAAAVSTLARAEAMRPQSMSAVIAALQESGLVQSAPDPNDRRQNLMSLTPKCLRWLRQGRSARQDWLTSTISQKLSFREQADLHSALDLLARLVED